MVSFLKQTDAIEWAEQQHERLVILKQMCSNAFLAFLIAISLILAKNCLLALAIVVVLVVLLLLVSLFWGYRVHELRLKTIDEEIVCQITHPKENNES